MEINKAIIPYAIPPLLSAIYALLLGIFVITDKKVSKVKLRFFLFLLSIVTWLAGFAAMNVMLNSNDAFIFSRVLYTGVILIPAFYYNFIIEFLNLKNRKWLLFIIYFLSVIFVFMLWFTKYFLKGNILYSWGYSSEAGIVHHFFLAYFFIIFMLAFMELRSEMNRYKKIDMAQTNRIKYVIIAFGIALCGSTDYLSTYHIDYYPLGFLFMITFSLITTYAILKHRLMDINVIIKKGVLYTVFLSFTSLLFILAIMAVNTLSQIYFGRSSLFFVYLATFLASILFIPIHNFFIEILNRKLFGASALALSERNLSLMKEVEQKDRMEAVATLAAGMAHEIKNPLTAIKTFTEYLPEKRDDPNFVDQFTKVVNSEVSKIDSIVKQLLEFSKPSPPRLERIDLIQIINDTLLLLDAECVKQRIEVVKIINKEAAWINGDKKQLQQAFLNLFLNSIQAMPSGGTLTVSVRNQSNLKVLVTISDTGCGIPKENLSHIFDPFFTTKASGTGLGLAISHGIFKEHLTKIEIKSVLNQGTKLILSFPQIT